MSTKFVLSVQILLLVTSLAESTSVGQCNNVQTPVVDIANCEEPPCVLVHKTNAIMIVSFNSTKYVRKLEAKVRAKVGPVNVPYPLPSEISNVCNNLLNTHCPLEENEPGVYKLQMYIEEFFPAISVLLTFTIETTEKEKLACFTVPCQVVTGNRRKNNTPNTEIKGKTTA